MVNHMNLLSLPEYAQRLVGLPLSLAVAAAFIIVAIICAVAVILAGFIGLFSGRRAIRIFDWIDNLLKHLV